MQFDKRGLWIMHHSHGRKDVYIQEGHIFDATGKRLPLDVQTLEARGYSTTRELREQVVEQMVSREYEARRRAMEAEMEARKHDLLENIRRDLTRKFEGERKTEYPSIEDPSEVVTPPLELTETEISAREIFSDVVEEDLSEDSLDDGVLDEEDDDEGKEVVTTSLKSGNIGRLVKAAQNRRKR